MKQGRHRHTPLVYLWAALGGFTAAALLSVLVDFDRTIAAMFYHPTHASPWFVGERPPWIWLYRYGEYPALVAAVAAGLIWLGSWRWPSWVHYRRGCALLVLAVALGPGLLVNGVLKPLWGRPRPRQIESFGGSVAYRPWWQPGGLSQGRSFPSGHAAMGYILVVGVCLVPPSRAWWLRPLVCGVALTYGTLLGYTRLLQGGHFASDVIYAGGLMCGTVAVLYMVLPPFLPGSTPSTPHGEAGRWASPEPDEACPQG